MNELRPSYTCGYINSRNLTSLFTKRISNTETIPEIKTLQPNLLLIYSPPKLDPKVFTNRYLNWILHKAPSLLERIQYHEQEELDHLHKDHATQIYSCSFCVNNRSEM